MKIAYRSLLLSCVLFPCIGCDQATKQIAMFALDDSPHTYLDGILRLQLSYNSGAFLSIGDNLSPLLRQSIFFWGVAVLLLTSLLCLLFAKRITRPQIIGLGLCFAGGISNLIDRVRFNGNVVDFLKLGVKHLRTGIFNVADMVGQQVPFLNPALLLLRQSVEHFAQMLPQVLVQHPPPAFGI